MVDDKPIIKSSTPNSNSYDTKIDIYTSAIMIQFM